MPNYVVILPQFDIEADNPVEAVEQALQTFIDYPSSRIATVREYGTERSVAICPYMLDLDED